MRVRPRNVETPSTGGAWRESLGATASALALLAAAGTTLSLMTHLYYYGQLGVGLLDVPLDKTFLILSGLAVTLSVAAMAFAFTTALVLGYRLARYLDSVLSRRRNHLLFPIVATCLALLFFVAAIACGLLVDTALTRDLLPAYLSTPAIGIVVHLALSTVRTRGSARLIRHVQQFRQRERRVLRLAFGGFVVLLLLMFTWQQTIVAGNAGKALASGERVAPSEIWFLLPEARYVTLTPVSNDPLKLCEKTGWRATKIASRSGSAIVLFIPPNEGAGRPATLEIPSSDYRIATPLRGTVAPGPCVKDPLLGR